MKREHIASIKKDLETNIRGIEVALGKDCCENIEGVKFSAGQIRGLRAALQLIEDYQRKERDDENIN